MNRDLFAWLNEPAIDTPYALMDDVGRYADPTPAPTPRVPVVREPAFDGQACMGVCCSIHGLCRRYANLDGASPDAPRIGRCSTGHERPGFVSMFFN